MRYSFLSSGAGMRALAKTELPCKAQATGPCRVMRTIKSRQDSAPPSPSLCGVTSWIVLPLHLPIPPTTLLTARGSSLTSTCDCAASPRGLLRRPGRAPGAQTWHTSLAVFLPTHSVLWSEVSPRWEAEPPGSQAPLTPLPQSGAPAENLLPLPQHFCFWPNLDITSGNLFGTKAGTPLNKDTVNCGIYRIVRGLPCLDQSTKL